MLGANVVVAWVERKGFQKAEALAGVACTGHGAAEFRSAEEGRIHQLKA